MSTKVTADAVAVDRSETRTYTMNIDNPCPWTTFPDITFEDWASKINYDGYIYDTAFITHRHISDETKYNHKYAMDIVTSPTMTISATDHNGSGVEADFCALDMSTWTAADVTDTVTGEVKPDVNIWLDW